MRPLPLAFALVLAGCGGHPPALGVLLAVDAEAGRQAAEGIESVLAVRPDLRVVRATAGSSPEAARAGFRELVEGGARMIVAAIPEGNARALADLARSSRVPLLASACEAVPDYTFSMAASSREQGREFARRVRLREPERLRVVLVLDRSRQDLVEMAEAFRDEWQGQGGLVADEVSFSPPLPPQTPILERALAGGPDALLLAADAADVLAMLQGGDAPALGSVLLLGAAGFNDVSVRQQLGQRGLQGYALQHGAGDAPEGVALAHDAMALAAAVFDPALSGETLASRVRLVRRFPGLSGELTMGADGHPRERPLELVELR